MLAVGYEWDDAKAASNIAKHGIDFLDATAPGEERIRTIGMTDGRILFVVTTIREENLYRIISARKATRHEQDRYYANSH